MSDSTAGKTELEPRSLPYLCSVNRAPAANLGRVSMFSWILVRVTTAFPHLGAQKCIDMAHSAARNLGQTRQLSFDCGCENSGRVTFKSPLFLLLLVI